MRSEGFAAILAVLLVVVALFLSFALFSQALGSFRTERHLASALRAKQGAESGVDQVYALLKEVPLDQLNGYAAQVSGHLTEASYTATVSCSGPEGEAYTCRVDATGLSGQARKRSRAIVLVTTEARSFLREGWFTGGTVRVNGNLQLMGTRLHGDGGYTLSDRELRICDALGQNCVLGRDDPHLARTAITAGLNATVCGPSGSPLCPPRKVCPVWGAANPNDSTPCYDSLAGRMATVGTASRILPPDIRGLYASLIGLMPDDNPFSELAPSECSATADTLGSLISLLATPPQGTICYTGSLSLSSVTLQIPPGVSLVIGGALDLDTGARLVVGGKLYVRNGFTAARRSGGVEVDGGEVVVGGQTTVSAPLVVNQGKFLTSGLELTQSASATFTRALVASSGSASFATPFTATDSKVLVNSGLTFNPSSAPILEGNTTLVVNGSLTFNGTLKSNLQGSPMLVASGDVTFNGRYADSESASFVWATGKVTMNGNTEYRGGLASGGGVATATATEGIVVNGGLTLYRTNLANDLLPAVQVTQVKIVARR